LTVNPKSASEMGRHSPPVLVRSRFGFPEAAAARKRSQGVRGAAPIVPSPMLVGARECVKGADILSGMALPLLLTTALASVGSPAAGRQGFVLSAQLAQAAPAARPLVGEHVRWAIPAVLLSVFSQSMVISCFIGTGRLVKSEVAGYPEEAKMRVLAALRR